MEQVYSLDQIAQRQAVAEQLAQFGVRVAWLTDERDEIRYYRDDSLMVLPWNPTPRQTLSDALCLWSESQPPHPKWTTAA